MKPKTRITVVTSAVIVIVGMLVAVADGQLRTPRKTKDVSPVYPRESLEAGDEGVILLELKVSPSGTVTDALILRSECKRLEQAAVTAARQWQYAPIQVNERPVPFTIVVNVPFRLPERFKERAGRAGACKWKEPQKPFTE